jgi:hypothetical protein
MSGLTRPSHSSMTRDAVSFAESFDAALLSWSLIRTQPIPSFDGSSVLAPPLIVTGWCTSVPPGADCLAVPRRSHHVGDQGFPGCLNGVTAKVTMFTTIQGIGWVGTGALPGCAGEAGGASRDCVRKLEPGVYDLTVGILHRLATALGVQ